MLLVNSALSFLRAEKQLFSALTIAARRSYWNLKISNTEIQDILRIPNPSRDQWKQVYEYAAKRRSESDMSPYSTLVKMIQDVGDKGATLKSMKLYEHLLNSNYEPNIAEQLLFMKVCFTGRRYVCKTHEEELVRLYNEITTTCPYLDDKSLATCLEGLSLTDRWKEVENFLENDKDLLYNIPRVYSCLVIAAFSNNQFNLGWKYVREAHAKNLYLEQYVYSDYVHICSKNKQTFKQHIEAMFEIWGEYGITPLKEVIAEYIHVFRKLGLNAWYTTIFPTGKCERCNHKLGKVNISKADQQQLADFAMQRLIVGSDIYINTSPREKKSLEKFMERAKPYDVVIDGLNLYYKSKSFPMQLENLTKSIVSLEKTAKGIVVILREHVKNINFLKILRNAKIFYVSDLTKDDPYLLYVAWSGEENTKFISADTIRDHRAAMSDVKLRLLFTRWVLARQYLIQSDGTLICPKQYEQTTQKSCNIWHVSFRRDRTVSNQCFLNAHQQSWACFQF